MRQYTIVREAIAKMDKRVGWGPRWRPWPSSPETLGVAAQSEAREQPVIRQAFAEWCGGVTGGKGTVTTDGGGLLKMPYAPETQLRGTPNASPEELPPALCAASFCLELLAELAAFGIDPRSIHTTATLTMGRAAQGLDPLQLRLEVTAWVPGVDRLNFERAAEKARDGWQSPVPLRGKPTISVNVNAW